MLNGWLWCDRSRKHCQDFTCSSFTKSFCICINLWRYILPYLESIFYSMSLSILSILCWSFLDMLDSLQYVVWTLLRRSLRFCWRQSIECSFRFPTRRLAQIRRCPLWNLLWAESIWVSSVCWLLWPLDSRWSQAVARMLFHLWICGGAEKGPGDFIGCAHAGIFTCQGLLVSLIFDLIDSRFKIEDSVLRSVTVEHAHKLDHNLKLSWNISKSSLLPLLLC